MRDDGKLISAPTIRILASGGEDASNSKRRGYKYMGYLFRLLN